MQILDGDTELTILPTNNIQTMYNQTLLLTNCNNICIGMQSDSSNNLSDPYLINMITYNSNVYFANHKYIFGDLFIDQQIFSPTSIYINSLITNIDAWEFDITERTVFSF